MPKLTAADVITQYTQAKAIRSVHEDDWRKAAAFCLPSHYASWQMEGPANRPNGAAVRRIAYDTTGARSLPKYVSVLERLSVPAGQRWHGLTASDTSLRKKARVRSYFEDLTNLMFQNRYHPRARFRISANEVFGSMGTYGSGPMFIGQRQPTILYPQRGIKYLACPLRDVYMLVDDEGELCGVFRRYWLNVRQFKIKFPGVALPKCMKSEDKPNPNENAYFEFVHFVSIRTSDYDKTALDHRRHPVSSVNVCVKDPEFVGDERGFSSMPYVIPRTATVAGDPYGYSPAVLALAALGGASAMKKTNLKMGNKAADPPLLAHDDNASNGEVDLRPGALNYGTLDREGRPLLRPLESGNFRVAEVLLQDERKDIEDSFFVTLFQILNETPEMTATEVIERTAEKAALLSPTMGRLQSEFLGPTIDREIALYSEMGMLPEMPPELVEAKGQFEVVYTSPLAKSMYAEEVSGFMRSVEMTLGVVNATKNVGLLDIYDFDVALPEIADNLAVPSRWMATQDKIDAARGQRAQDAQQQQLMQNAGGVASAAKTAQEMTQQ